MTTIAWDGRMLAADRLVTTGDHRCGAMTKVARAADGRLLAASGLIGAAAVALDMLARGERPAMPDGSRAVEVAPDGVVRHHVHEGAYAPDPGPFALGSGAPFALAAMACGKTAAEAVEIACRFDVWSGGGVDVLVLGEDRA